jgi:PAS domain S-box-containing protein
MFDQIKMPLNHQWIDKRSAELLRQHQQEVYVRADRLFAGLFVLQWLAAVLVALVLSPMSWTGTTSSIHIHVWTALFLGALLSTMPIYMVHQHPGSVSTRHCIAIAQALYSALFIHLSGGRIETHFHVFGSLALLAFYRDWKVLVTASSVIALDHFIRGEFFPQSVFGVPVASHWRWIEHALWVVFEDLFLIRSCLENTREMNQIAITRAEVEAMDEVNVQRERFRTLCELSPVGIFQTNEHGELTFANPRWHEIMDSSPEQSATADWLALIHPQDRELFISAWQECLRNGTKFSHECRVQSSDQSARWVIFMANEVKVDNRYAAVIGTVQDITRRKEAELANASLAKIVEMTNDAICSYDLQGNLVSWNESASKLFGFDSKDLLGQSFEVLPADHDFPVLLEKVVRGEAVTNHETARTRKNGSTVEVAVTASALRDSSAKLTGISVIARDITNKKEAEKRIAEFYSTISHELRTPLTSIRGALSLIDEGVVDPSTAEGKDLIRIAKSSSIRLIRLINEILDLRKIEVGKLTLHLTPTRVSTLVSNAVSSMVGMAAENQVKLVSELNCDAEMMIDNDRLTQVLTNLISNAVKFSAQGAVVRVKVEQLDNNIRFSVVDSGCGIPEHEQHKLFGKFQQVDSSDSRPKEGTGLGLAICKALVEEHHGKIGVTSKPAHGSTFYFDLPHTASLSMPCHSANDIPNENMVLICEDDADLAFVIKNHLSIESIECHTVFTRGGCLEYLEENVPAAILLDLNLPDGDGIGVIEYARSNPRLQNVPIIVISGDPDQRDFAMPIIFEFIPKPFDRRTLMSAIERAIGRREHKRVLIVDDDADTRAVVAAQLKSLKVQCLQAAAGDEAISMLMKEHIDLLILDVGMPKVDGFAVVDWLRSQRKNGVPLLVYSGRDLNQTERDNLSLSLTKHLVKGSASEDEFLSAVRELLMNLVGAPAPQQNVA